MALPSRCPRCFAPLEAATPVASGQPSRGPAPHDLSVCLYCGEILQFDEQLQLRVPSPEEVAVLPGILREQLEVAQRVVRSLRSARSATKGEGTIH